MSQHGLARRVRTSTIREGMPGWYYCYYESAMHTLRNIPFRQTFFRKVDLLWGRYVSSEKKLNPLEIGTGESLVGIYFSVLNRK